MKRQLAPITAPTGLRRADAALHCGVSPSYFDELVRLGILPPPRRLGSSVKLWMRHELDEALFSLPVEGLELAAEAGNPCDVLLR